MRKLTIILVVLAFASTAGAWSDWVSGVGDWTDAAGWNNGVPTYPGGHGPALGTGGTHVITITAADDIDAQGMLGPAWNGHNTLNVAGTLNMLTQAPMGGAYSMTMAWEDNTVGTLNITGSGKVTDAIGIVLGQKGNATINVSDNGLLTSPLIDLSVGLAGFHLEQHINVTGNGMIILDGDQRADMTQAFFDGILNVLPQADLNGDGNTVIGVPEPATMLLLGLGGLALIRRKRA